MDRRDFLQRVGVLAGGVAVGGVGVALAQGEGGDSVVLRPGESKRIDCEALPEATTSSSSTTPPPDTTSTTLATTSSQPMTSSTQPTGPVFVSEPLPQVWDRDMELGAGQIHNVSGSCTIRARSFARGAGFDRPTRVKLNGGILRVDVAEGTWDWAGTAPANGHWSEGPGAWVPGQEAVVAAWGKGAQGWNTAPSAFNGQTVGGNADLGRLAEVAHVQRDIVIEGPGEVRVEGPPQRLAGLGPAVTLANVRITGCGVAGVVGAYPLHFHLCGDASRGSTVTGVVIDNTFNRGAVTHESHGVTWGESVTWLTRGDAWWWDEGFATHDVLYRHCLALDTRPPVGLATNRWRRGAAFALGRGNGNRVIDCHAAGVTGAQGTCGFLWNENQEGIWEARGLVAHGINTFSGGAFTWQNTPNVHVVEIDAYDAPYGIEHGAYHNPYDWRVRTASCDVAGFGLHAMGPEGTDGPDLLIDHTHLGPGTPFRLLPPPRVPGRRARLRANYPLAAPPITIDPNNTNGSPLANTVANRLTSV